jgi:hypothetical protein
MDYYFENPNGDTNENISFSQIKKAISNLKEINDEHSAFWVGDNEGIAVIEVHKSLKLFIFIEAQETQFEIQLENEKEAEGIFKLFLSGKLDSIIKIINEKK